VKQYRFKAGDFVPKEQIPDAFLSESDQRELQRLAGIEPAVESMQGINISKTGMEKQRLEREHDIKPGTPEWFKLWFSLPYMTGEKPVNK
jgi:hypothetical protein